MSNLDAHDEDRRFWAAIMLATNVDVCDSILRFKPVRVADLDSEQLRRARRGRRGLDPEAYLLVDVEMLDAVAEAGLKPMRGKGVIR